METWEHGIEIHLKKCILPFTCSFTGGFVTLSQRDTSLGTNRVLFLSFSMLLWSHDLLNVFSTYRMTFSSNPSIGMMQLNPVMQPCKCFSNPRCSFQTIDSSERSESCPASHFDHIGPSTACEHGWSAHLTMALQIIGRSATMRMAWPCARIMASCGWSAMEAKIQSKVQPNHALPMWTPWTPHALCLQNRFQDGALTGISGISQVKLEVPGVNQTAMEAVHTRRQLRRWKYRRKRDGGKDRKFRLKYGWGSESQSHSEAMLYHVMPVGRFTSNLSLLNMSFNP